MVGNVVQKVTWAAGPECDGARSRLTGRLLRKGLPASGHVWTPIWAEARKLSNNQPGKSRGKPEAVELNEAIPVGRNKAACGRNWKKSQGGWAEWAGARDGVLPGGRQVPAGFWMGVSRV